MGQNFSHLFNIFRKLCIAFAVFTLCRILFVLFNLSHFENIEFSAFFFGLRFDMVALSFLLAPMIFIGLLPAPFRNFKFYQKAVSTLFYIGLFFGMALNLIDLAYFDFTLKRTTADFFNMISTGEDFWTLLPNYIIDFWYAYLVLAVLIFVVVKVHKKLRHVISSFKPYTGKDYLHHIVIFVLGMGLLVVGMRGGVQYRPIGMINAGQYVSAQNIPIVLNTPFSVMKTISSNTIEERKFYPENELEVIYSPLQSTQGSGQFVGKNVVIIILESFSKEYVGYLNQTKGYTPFLDSLMQESYVFTNAYANGQRSMESLPSIFAGIPQMMNTPYVSSTYANNQLDGLPRILSNQGYNTSFYHGGANGTMGFNGFAGLVGMDNYFGLDEYPEQLKKEHYDGKWGIFDEPYLQYYVNELSAKKEPFFSTLFTLSSHHPYAIPADYTNTFDKGKLPIHESIGYTDNALKLFFKTAKNQPWFKNTIFVFTADHTSLTERPYYKTKLNRFAIPIFIYDPNLALKGKDDMFFQQLDITPTIIDLLGIKTDIISFGNSAFSSQDRYVVNYVNGIYQFAKGKYFLLFDGEKTWNFFNLEKDPLLTKNIMKELTEDEKRIHKEMEDQLKAIIQQYNHRVITNQLSASGQS